MWTVVGIIVSAIVLPAFALALVALLVGWAIERVDGVRFRWRTRHLPPSEYAKALVDHHGLRQRD